MTKTTKKPQDNATFCREASIKVNDNSNQVELSFSSEEPYLRYFGYEVLSHDAGAVDLTRLNEIGVLLYNHDRDKVIGKIIKAWIEDKRGKALVQFDDDAESQVVFEKVKSGTLKGVSVGYSISEWEELEAPDDEEPTWIAKKWQPYEISIVSVPADASVGVGRSLEEPNKPVELVNEPDTVDNNELSTKGLNTSENDIELKNENTTIKQEISIMENNENQAAAVVDTEAVLKTERARVADINAMCRDFDVDPEQFITSGASLDNVRAAILNQLKAKKAPANVTAVNDNADNFRAHAVDSLVMRSGSKVENASNEARALSSLSLKDLAVECLAHDGVKSHNELRRMNHDQVYDELQRAYFNPTSSFPAILDQTIQKNIVQLYKAVPTTFQLWTTKGSVTDFKESKDHNYLIGGGSFELVGENGELKQSKPSTEILPTRKIDTYGAQFTMTRQAFINDDIGFLAQVPGLYAAAAKRKINQQVYELLVNNSKIYDGKTLFHADHGNLAGTGSAPSMASINELMLKMQTQKDPFGQAINVTPQLLVLPVGHGLTVDTILHSTSITTSESNNTGYNPMAGRGLSYIEDPVLNALAGTGAAAWYMIANPLTAKSIQVDYLNGNEMPTIRRSEKAGQLGFAWDIFLDWGITAIDYRGIAKNAGVKVTI